MAHQRLLKPEFFTDDKIADLTPIQRLFYMGIWTQADKNGVLEDRPKQLKTRILPYDECDAIATVNELVYRGFLIRYKVGERQLLAVRTWKKNQSTHSSEKPSGLPEVSQATDIVALPLINAELTQISAVANAELTAFPVPVPVPVPSPSPSPNISREKREKVPDQRHAPLIQKLEAEYLAQTGSEYGFDGGRDAKSVSKLLKKGTDEEILIRWKRGLAAPSGWKAVRNIHELDSRWNHLGQDAPRPGARDLTRGYARADDSAWADGGGFPGKETG